MPNSLLFAVSVSMALTLAQTGWAQRPPAGPPPLPGIPVVQPPVDHPALAGQPLIPRSDKSKEESSPAGTPAHPDTTGIKKAGRELHEAVERVMSLRWHDSLALAKADAAAQQKPILWLYALGDLDGLASSSLQSLRGLTLSADPVFDLLDRRYVLGFTNIERARHVGLSLAYRRNQSAAGATNGSGGRNVQIVILAADETVLHALAGFWHAADLVPELELGLALHRLHARTALGESDWRPMFEAMHRAHLRRYGDEATSRGNWLRADSAVEIERARAAPRDTVVVAPDGSVTLKPIVRLQHERIQAVAFRPLAGFDFEAFVDYGQPHHDNNAAVDAGRTFPRAEQNQRRRERELARR